MRLNEPITHQEVELRDGLTLVAQTDGGGKIVFANHPHNHPHRGSSEPNIHTARG